MLPVNVHLPTAFHCYQEHGLCIHMTCVCAPALSVMNYVSWIIYFSVFLDPWSLWLFQHKCLIKWSNIHKLHRTIADMMRLHVSRSKHNLWFFELIYRPHCRTVLFWTQVVFQLVLLLVHSKTSNILLAKLEVKQ